MVKENLKKLMCILLFSVVIFGDSTCSARVIGYVTESEGVRYEYSQDDLIESIIGGTGLYHRYKGEKLIALRDDKNGYIDAEDVISAIVKATIGGERLMVDLYTESQVAKVIELEGVKRLDSSGEIIEGGEPGDFEEDYTDSRYFEFNRELGQIRAYSEHGPKNVFIPDTIDGVKVVSIGPEAFAEMDLATVDIPDTVTSIGWGAFSDNGLVSVKIGNSVTSIGKTAFMHNNLSSLSIPDSVTSIGNWAFSNNSLGEADVKLGSGHPSFWLYDKEDKTMVKGHILGGNRGELIIPEGVKVIYIGAFTNNRLSSVEIPEGVTHIGNQAFSRNSLTKVVIPPSVKHIGWSAFESNILETAKLPNHTLVERNSFDPGVSISRY